MVVGGDVKNREERLGATAVDKGSRSRRRESGWRAGGEKRCGDDAKTAVGLRILRFDWTTADFLRDLFAIARKVQRQYLVFSQAVCTLIANEGAESSISAVAN